MKNNPPQSIHVTIKNKREIIFEDYAKAVSSSNEQGVFDILPMHENFITIVKGNLVIHKETGVTQQIQITQGLLKVFENNINIYLELTK